MAYIPRLSKGPSADGYLHDMWMNPWWYHAGSGGSGNPYTYNWGLPNCTCYAYGRSCEIANRWLNYPTSNAEDWWYDSRIQSQRGQTPALGAVIVWHSTRSGGHVAVVEQIINNDEIRVSYSGYAGFQVYNNNWNYNREYLNGNYFTTAIIRRQTGWLCPYMLNYPTGTYTLLGYIYNEYADSAPVIEAEWHAKTYPRYDLISLAYVHWTSGSGSDPSNYVLDVPQEALENAYLMWGIFAEHGWTLNAACAVIGTCSYESGLNPWSWQDANPVASTNTAWLVSGPRNNLGPAWNHGYGLNGLTPMFGYPPYVSAGYSSSYRYGDKGPEYSTFDPHYDDIMGSPDDGDAQVRFMIKGATQWEHYTYRGSLFDYTHHPYIPINEFINSTGDLHELTRQWVWNYGAGAHETEETIAKRASAAIYFYSIFSGWTPPDSVPDSPNKKNKMPVWMMLKYF